MNLFENTNWWVIAYCITFNLIIYIDKNNWFSSFYLIFKKWYHRSNLFLLLINFEKTYSLLIILINALINSFPLIQIFKTLVQLINALINNISYALLYINYILFLKINFFKGFEYFSIPNLLIFFLLKKMVKKIFKFTN